jgi:hypothetical protein
MLTTVMQIIIPMILKMVIVQIIILNLQEEIQLNKE